MAGFGGGSWLSELLVVVFVGGWLLCGSRGERKKKTGEKIKLILK